MYVERCSKPNVEYTWWWRQKGNQLIQAGGTLNSISATIVPVLVGYLMGTVVEERTIAKALPALYIAMAIFAVAFLVLFFMQIPEPRLEKLRKQKQKILIARCLSVTSFLEQ